MIIFEKQSLDRMKEDAECKYPKECCGILLGRRSETGERIVEEVYSTVNAAHDKQERQFRIDPLTLFKVERYAEEIDMEVIGFYHSHPDCLAEASAEDESFALPGCSYPILSVIHGAVCDIQCWRLTGEGEYNKLPFRKETIQCQERGEIILCQ